MLRLHEYAYHRPGTLDEALALLDEHGESAMPIAGGTDVMPNMKHRLFTPDHLVALKGVSEMRGIDLDSGARELRVGAAETLSTVSGHPLVRDHFPSLATAAGNVAGPQLRNMGTIGGNLCLDTRCTYYNQTHFWRKALGFCLKKDGDTCHVTRVGTKCVAAHSADTPPVLMTLNAVADLAGPGGRRTVPVADFFVPDGEWNTVREPDELVTAVRLPLPGPGLRASFQKLRERNSIDFPILNVAVAAELEDDGVVRDLRIVVSALGSRPRTLTRLEQIAGGERLTDDVVEAVAERAHKQCRPLTNIITDPEWRRAMVPVHVRRALEEVREGLE